jgi:putative oxidoreductase
MKFKLFQNKGPLEHDWFLFMVRLAASLFMMTHGFDKLEKLLAGGDIKFYNFLGLGPKISLVLCIIGEFVAPIFVILGYQFRWACNLVVFTMFVAAYGAHFGETFSEKEHSMLYFLLFLLIKQTGPGKFSLEYFLKSRKA